MVRCASSNGVSGPFYILSILMFMGAIMLGAAFIVTSMSSRFFKWTIDTCDVSGRLIGGGTSSSSKVVNYDLDVDADIGWREFTITYLDSGAAGAECFTEIEEGGSYAISDFQDNSGSAAGFGMAAAWVLAILVAFVTVAVMISALCRSTSKKGGFSLTTLTNWCALFTVGIVVATTVFWWMIEGKFGDRSNALAPRLLALVATAAERCNDGTNSVNPCQNADWEIETPGSSLTLGITAMFMYGTATLLLWMRAGRVDAILNGSEEPEPEAVKHIVGADFVADKQQVQTPGDDKARAKDRRSARTGGRAPTSTVPADAGPDPMTYALEEGVDEESGSQDDNEEEVVYQNHQVHPSVVNHSTPNRTQVHVDETMSRQSEAMSRASPAVIGTAQRQRAYSRGYSRGTSSQSYTTGGHSFEAPSEGDYSETASSAFYHQGHNADSRSYASAGSRDSFDSYAQ